MIVSSTLADPGYSVHEVQQQVQKSYSTEFLMMYYSCFFDTLNVLGTM